MRKNAVVLLITGMVSCTAFAQSNVTIYGVVDMSYTMANNAIQPGTRNMSAINGSGQGGSRLGFVGKEDLGNDLAATFRLEMGLNPDTGTAAQGGRTFGRWSTVGLASKQLGEVQLGHRDSIADQFMGGIIDPVNGGTIARHNVIWGKELTERYDNAAVWLSPNWNGLELKAAVSTNQNDSTKLDDVEPARNTTAAQTYSNRRAYDIGANYQNGPLVVGGSYQYNKMQQVEHLASVRDYVGGNFWQVGGAYDFKVVRLSAAFARVNYAENNLTTANAGYYASLGRDHTDRWIVGLSAPIGAIGKLAVNFGKQNVDFSAANQDNAKSKHLGVAYFHELSKRTNLYAAYARVTNNDVANSSALTNTGDKVVISDISGGPAGNYRQGIQFGIRHKF